MQLSQQDLAHDLWVERTQFDKSPKFSHQAPLRAIDWVKVEKSMNEASETLVEAYRKNQEKKI